MPRKSRKHDAEPAGAAARKAPSPAPEARAVPADAAPPPPGLDAARHAAAQRAAHQAEVLGAAVFPALMASALGLDGQVGPTGYKVYLERLLREAGSPEDPIEAMLLQQLALAHFRIGQLHASAGHAPGAEAAKIYNAGAARLLGEFRRTALALRAYRSRVPEGRPENVKLFKAAQ
jgi:hypothetical protein